jgi:hypothetical protein
MAPSIIRRTDLVVDGEVDRLDAEYFEADLIAEESKLRSLGATALSDSATIVDERVPDPRRHPDAEGVFQYVEIGGIDSADGFVLPDLVRHCDAPSRARLALQVGDVAMSSVRPTRNQVFFVSDDLADAVGTTGLVVLRPDGVYDGLELVVLLKTSPVIRQLARRARASMYPTLNPPDVLDVLLQPLSNTARRSVRGRAQEAQVARSAYLKSASELRSVSARFFNSRGGREIVRALAVHSPTHRAANSLRVGPESAIGRLDAEYHSAAFDDVFSEMRHSGPTAPLSKVVVAARRGRSFTTAELSDQDDGGPAVLKVGSLSRTGVRWADVGFANGKPAPSSAELVAAGDVLFNAAAHEPSYIAHRVDVVGSIPSGYSARLITTSHVGYLRIGDQEKWPPHFLAAFLRHPLGFLQIRRSIRGVRAEVYPNDVVGDLIVPQPPKGLRDQIVQLATESERQRWRYAAALRGAIDVAESDWDSQRAPRGRI